MDETETGSDARFWLTNDEEFDVRNLFDQSTHDGENGRLGVFIAHSSNASMIMTVEMSDEVRGPTIKVAIWIRLEERDEG